MSSARDHGRQNWIRRLSWPRGRSVNQIPSRVDGVPFPVHPGCRPARAPRSPSPPRPASMDVPASRTRAKLPPVAVFHVSSTAPPCARVSPSAAAARLLTRHGMAGTRAAQRRAVALPRRRLAALGLHPVALWVNRRRFDGLAAPTVAACLRHVPARRRHVLLELAWHGRCACVCLQYNGISAHYCNVPRQSEGSFAQAIDESLLRVGGAS